MRSDHPLFHTPASSLPVVGVLPALLRKRRELHELFLQYAAEAQAVGKPFVWLRYGPLHRMALVADPVVAEEILRSPHFADRTSFPIIDATYAQFVGTSAISANMGGITFVNGEPWRRNRMAALRCLSRPSFLDETRSVTQACTDRLLTSWRARGLVGSGAHIDLGRELSRLAIDVMGQLCWKSDLGAITGDHDRFVEPVRTMLEAIQRYIYVPLPAPLLAWLPTPTLRRLRAAVRQLRSIGDGLMAPRFDAGGRLRLGDTADDVLGNLLKELVTDHTAPAKDDLDHVQATLMDLLGAGHDTTANAMAFCLGLLAQPTGAPWQERAAVEAHDSDTVQPRSDGASAPVLTAAYREALRLYPPGAMFSRVASQDTSLTLGGGTAAIPVGTQMFVSPYVMGRDARAFREAAHFQPQRHLSTQGAGSCPHLTKLRAPGYAPYGGGKRSCVGALLAEVEAMAALGRIVRSLRIELVAGDAAIEADLLFTLRPRRPLLARVYARTPDRPAATPTAPAPP